MPTFGIINLNEDSGTCEHKYVYQGIVYLDQDAYIRYFYYLYFCEKCLRTRTTHFETSVLGNRYHLHPYPEATKAPK